MMHLFHVEGCPRLLSNFLFFFDVNESRHRPGVIVPIISLSFDPGSPISVTDLINSDDWVSNGRLFTSFPFFRDFFPWGETLWSVCMTGSDWFHRDWHSSWFPTRPGFWLEFPCQRGLEVRKIESTCGSWVFWGPTFGSSRVVLPKQGPQAVHAIQRSYHVVCVWNLE